MSALPPKADIQPPWTYPPLTHRIPTLPRIWEGTVSMAEERVQRRLVATLAADAVGYSWLIEAEERGAR